MFKRLLVIALFCPFFISLSATGQDTGRVREAVFEAGGTRSGKTGGVSGFHLRGVLISQSGRSALVNDRLSREGDRVAGAEILAITEGGVRILVGSQELTVPVGARAMAGSIGRP